MPSAERCSTRRWRRWRRSGGSSTYGVSGGATNTVNTRKLMRASRTVTGFWFRHCLDRPAELLDAPLADLFSRASRDELRVVIGATYPLEQAAQAQIDLVERRTTGKLLLDVR